MSAPQTNVEKQEQRHKPALFGIRAAMIWGALMIVLLIGYNIWFSGQPDAVTSMDDDGAVTSTVPTDTYAPGTNNSGTPTDPAANTTPATD